MAYALDSIYTGLMFALTTEEGWQAGIGDPTFAGWFTVFAYLATAFLCWIAAKAALIDWKRSGKRDPVLFWLILFALLLLLGINKQLDLQTWFTHLGKQIAQAQGWYESRRVVQAIFITGIAFGGAWLLWIFYRLTRGAICECRTALIGGFFLICFVVIRAASFHYVDQMLGFRLTGLKLNWILELGGILSVAVGALIYLQHHRPSWTFRTVRRQ